MQVVRRNSHKVQEEDVRTGVEAVAAVERIKIGPVETEMLLVVPTFVQAGDELTLGKSVSGMPQGATRALPIALIVMVVATPTVGLA